MNLTTAGCNNKGILPIKCLDFWLFLEDDKLGEVSNATFVVDSRC